MSKRLIAGGLLALLLVLGFQASDQIPVGADEGMWLPPELGRNLPLKRLTDMGFELERKDLWSSDAPSLKDAIVQVIDFQPNGGVFGFGSASFVSAEGLILTNHHVAFDAIAANSNTENNYVRDGFRAATLADEKQCRGQGVRICTAFEDVTAAVLAGIKAGGDEGARRAAVSEAQKGLIEDAEKKGLRDVEVIAMYSGLRYYLVAYDTFRDLRLVYAPPRMVGEYGGDIDNWIWPRHTGDFTYLRAYVAPDGSRAGYSKDNVPYRPARHLKLATDGYQAGDFSFIMGFPGTTYRARTSWSVDYREKLLFPNQIKALGANIQALTKAGENDEEVRIRNLSQIKNLNNALKNNQGMMDGLKKFDLVAEKKAEEARFQAWVNEDAERRRKWGDLFPRFDGLYSELFRTDRLRGVMNLVMTRTVLSAFGVFQLSSSDPNGQSAERIKVVTGVLKNNLANLSLDEQRKSVAGAIQPFVALPKESLPAVLANADLSDLKAWSALVLPTAVKAEDIDRWAGLDGDGAAKEEHPLFKLGLGLAGRTKELNDFIARFGAEISPMRRHLAAAWAAWKANPLYPDANSTLRFTFGKICGYSPQDGIEMGYVTTSRGISEKNKAKNPFDAPQAQLDLIAKKDWGRWADPELGTLVLNFLSDNDITGGNSGSAIMNGKGEMIGLAFDGNYEAMTSDFRFQADITRTINVDIRYVLWCTEKLGKMTRLLDEMGLN
ncbi:MAG: S46 family peptidase [Planctomycetota bacterium]